MVDCHHIVTTQAKPSIFLRHYDNRCSPLTVVTLPDYSLLFQSIQFLSYSTFNCKWTGRGLKNFGVASGLMSRVALYEVTVPSSSLKRFECCCNRACTPWDPDCTVAILSQSSQMYFSQFLPKRFGPGPSTTANFRGEVCPL